MAGVPALEIKNLEAWYGESHVLHGVDIMVRISSCNPVKW